WSYPRGWSSRFGKRLRRPVSTIFFLCRRKDPQKTVIAMVSERVNPLAPTKVGTCPRGLMARYSGLTSLPTVVSTVSMSTTQRHVSKATDAIAHARVKRTSILLSNGKEMGGASVLLVGIELSE